MEVHAKLAALTQRAKAVKAKLADCAKHRASLQKDLQLSATKRAEAEQELQKCADDRQKLQSELALCGKDRAEAEGALAKCAAERAKLEAELRQCAEVDRPTAERELQECAVARAKLEKELSAVIGKLKGGASQTSKQRRRRRRKTSLAQTDAELQKSNAEAKLEAELEAQVVDYNSRMRVLARDVLTAEQKLERLFQREQGLETSLAKSVEAAERAAESVEKVDEREKDLEGKLEKSHAASDRAEKTLLDHERGLADAHNSLIAGGREVQDAQAELLKDVVERASVATMLLQLNLDAQHLRHKEINLAHEEQQRTLAELKVRLAMQEKDHDDCDETRAKLITQEEKINESAAALAACLATKAFIQEKIDAANTARQAAEKALELCVATKAKLTAALEECHKRRDATRAKLKECLDRKKVLKAKIVACHTARDAARQKLKECLSRKEVLKKKLSAAVAKMGGSLLEQGESQNAESDVEVLPLEEAVALLRGQSAEMADFRRAEKELTEDIRQLADEVRDHSKKEVEALDDLASADAAETAAEGGLADLEGQIQDVMDDFEAIGANESAARLAAGASEQQAAQAAGLPPP